MGTSQAEDIKTDGIRARPNSSGNRPRIPTPNEQRRAVSPVTSQVWSCKLELRPPKQLDQKSFDDFLKRQELQNLTKKKLRDHEVSMTHMQRMRSRGLLENHTAGIVSRLLLPSKSNTKSHLEFLQRQDAVAKRRVSRMLQGPIARMSQPKCKTQNEEDFLSFLARQQQPSSRSPFPHLVAISHLVPSCRFSNLLDSLSSRKCLQKKCVQWIEPSD